MKQRSINTFFTKATKSSDPGDAKENIKKLQPGSKAVESAVEETSPKNVKRRRLQQSSASPSPKEDAELEDLMDDVQETAKGTIKERGGGPVDTAADKTDPWSCDIAAETLRWSGQANARLIDSKGNPIKKYLAVELSGNERSHWKTR
eukprot:gene26243-17339_t